MPRLRSIPWCLACSLIAVLVRSAGAGDWPQILGPNRNGAAVDERLADTWPETGPTQLWSRPVGNGFAGPVVAGDAVVLFHRLGDEEVVEALDAATGEPRWKSAFGACYVPVISDDDGPRATPVIHRGRVYLYGAMGNLYCLDLATGKTIWSRDTYEEFNSKQPFHGEPAEGYFGIGSTPIVEGDKLLILKTDGVLVLAAANVDRYQELARAPVAGTTTRALPALAAGRLYLRDSRTLQCLAAGAGLRSP